MEQKLPRGERRKLALLRVTSFAAVMCFLLLLLVTAMIFSGMQRLVSLADRVDTVAAELTLTAAELSLVDWDALTDAILEAAGAAASGMDQAVQTLGELDLSSLNETVAELSEAVGPIAEFAKRFE